MFFRVPHPAGERPSVDPAFADFLAPGRRPSIGPPTAEFWLSHAIIASQDCHFPATGN
jgi:hypothetical protein